MPEHRVRRPYGRAVPGGEAELDERDESPVRTRPLAVGALHHGAFLEPGEQPAHQRAAQDVLVRAGVVEQLAAGEHPDRGVRLAGQPRGDRSR